MPKRKQPDSPEEPQRKKPTLLRSTVSISEALNKSTSTLDSLARPTLNDDARDATEDAEATTTSSSIITTHPFLAPPLPITPPQAVELASNPQDQFNNVVLEFLNLTNPFLENNDAINLLIDAVNLFEQDKRKPAVLPAALGNLGLYLLERAMAILDPADESKKAMMNDKHQSIKSSFRINDTDSRKDGRVSANALERGNTQLTNYLCEAIHTAAEQLMNAFPEEGKKNYLHLLTGLAHSGTVKALYRQIPSQEQQLMMLDLYKRTQQALSPSPNRMPTLGS